jgi:translocation and assembly module TamA
MKTIVSTILLSSALWWCCSVRAADPQPYKVDFVSVGNGDIDDTLQATSDLKSLRSSAPVSPFGLIARARGDTDRLKTVLESFGYYESRVIIKINGMLLTTPDLGATLSALPQGSTAAVEVRFTLGTLYQLRRIDIDGEVPEAINARAILGLTTGQPAVAASVLAGGARLLTALQEQGYAFAQVDPPIAYEAADAPALDLTFHVVAGGKFNVGEIRIDGLKRTHDALLRKRLLLHTGDLFKPSAIEVARKDLLAMNVFAQVSVQIGSQADASGGVPVTFLIRERPRHAITVNAAYSSDLGGSGGAAWTDRNVFGNAEQLSFAASVINLGGSDTTGTGYDIRVKYLIPDFLRRDQSIQFTLSATKQQLQAYDQDAKTAGVTLNRKLSSIWSASAGVTTTDEHIIQVGENFFYTLIALPLSVTYDSTNLPTPLDDPRHGFRASLSVAPTLAIGKPNSTFTITQLKVAAFYDLEKFLPIAPGRTVLAARALAGIALGAGEFSLPPDQRFYAGGSATIRGYGYQLVGPRFCTESTPTPNTKSVVTENGTCPAGSVPSDIPTGGTAITAAGLELRQRFGKNFGVTAFVDAGQVSASLRSAPDDIRIGAGAGLRYYTPIGPIRLDVAVPVNRRPGEDSFEIYIGLGQAF